MRSVGQLKFLRASNEVIVSQIPYLTLIIGHRSLIQIKPPKVRTIPWFTTGLSHVNLPCQLSTLSQASFS